MSVIARNERIILGAALGVIIVYDGESIWLEGLALIVWDDCRLVLVGVIYIYAGAAR